MSLSYETQMTAYKLLTEILGVKNGETVVIYSDTMSDEVVVDATAAAATLLGALPVVIKMPTPPKLYPEFPISVREAIKNADVFIEMGGGSVVQYGSTYFEMKNAKKARYTCLFTVVRDEFVKSLGRIDIGKTLALTEKLADLLNGGNKITVTSEAGTNLVANMEGRKASAAGTAKEPGSETMLIGQVGWTPMEDTINGTIVVDGGFDMQSVVIPRTPVTFKVKNGVIVEISGGPEANSLNRFLASFNHPNMYRIAHYTCGVNPGITEVTGKSILTDERKFGIFLFGFGGQGEYGVRYKAPSHHDGIVLDPDLWVDDLQLEKQGKWVHPDLVRICKEMGLPGY